MAEVTVKYVGLKDKEFDKKGGTGMWWARGESKAVPFAAWEKMAKHPDVWALDATDAVVVAGGLSDVGPKAVEAPVEIDLYNMNTSALREYAASKGLAVDLALKGAALRAAITALMAPDEA